jgi:hypothetical protein
MKERQNINHAILKTSFENAISTAYFRIYDREGSKCVSLWVLYLRYTFSQDPEKAKELCLKAVRHIPWVKEIYMIALEHSELFREHELKQLLTFAEEKEIRFRNSMFSNIIL